MTWARALRLGRMVATEVTRLLVRSQEPPPAPDFTKALEKAQEGARQSAEALLQAAAPQSTSHQETQKSPRRAQQIEESAPSGTPPPAAPAQPCAHCEIHRKLAHAEAFLTGIVEDCPSPEAPPPEGMRGTLVQARAEVASARQEALKIALAEPAQADVALRLAANLAELEKRLQLVATCGEAQTLAQAATFARQAAKGIAKHYFLSRKGAATA